MRYKAEILSVIYQRNAKRRQTQLPLLHVCAEYEAETTADREDDFELKVQAVVTDAIERSLTIKWVARWRRQHKINRWPRGIAAVRARKRKSDPIAGVVGQGSRPNVENTV